MEVRVLLLVFRKTQTQIKLDGLLEGQEKILGNQRTLSRNQLLLGRKIDALDRKLDVVEGLLFDLLLKGKPGLVTFTIVGERSVIGMADQIQFSVNLPAKAAPDVVSRELTVVIGDGEPDVRALAGDVLVVEGLEGDQDATVELSLVDIDDGGNRSEPSTASGVLVDTVAPPTPGALAIEVIGETFEEPELIP
jgi:hypothetical protein